MSTTVGLLPVGVVAAFRGEVNVELEVITAGPIVVLVDPTGDVGVEAVVASFDTLHDAETFAAALRLILGLRHAARP